MSLSIHLDGQEFLPAQLEGNVSVLEEPYFIIKKRTWQPDDAVSVCPLCKSKFGGLKRRHHCRQCGKVICNKCCSTKLTLPQFGIQEAERVCDTCYTVAVSVRKSRSQQMNDQYESAKALAELCQCSHNIIMLFQYGGFHTLLSLAGTHSHNTMIMRHVMKGLHMLVTYEALQAYMVDCQLLQALCRMMNTVCNSTNSDEQTLLDGISALVLLCKNEKIMIRVIAVDGLSVVLNLCKSESETVVLLALRALSLMISHPASQKLILDGENPALKNLLSLAASNIEQVQATALQSLVCLSVGSDWVKHRLVQEDFTAGRPMKTAIQSTSDNVEIRIYAAALIANVATCPENMTALAEPIDCMIEILQSSETNEDLLSHVTRGLANFSKFKENSYKMKSILPVILEKCVNHTNKTICTHGLRLVMYQLSYDPGLANDDALRAAAGTVLQSLLQISGVMESVFSVLYQKAPPITKPF